jgi:integrase
MCYFGRWDDPEGALREYQEFLAGGSRDRPRQQPTDPAKPSKPYPDFPLFAHAAGVWAKKIRGKIHYFGPWGDPDGALEKYLEQKDALHAGRKAREAPEGLMVKDLVNRFLNAKQNAVNREELSPRTWACYKEACDAAVAALGKRRLVSDLGPDDFATLRDKMAARWGPHGLGTRIQCVRCAFKFAFDSELIVRPVRYGPEFKRPSKKTLRLHRAKQGPKLFTAEEIRKLLGAAGLQLKAMILLGVNAGFGNADCGTLPLVALDLETGIIDFPRPKTGVPRRCPLWPETIKPLREVMAKRTEPSDPAAAGLVFVTKYGSPWHKDKGSLGNRPITHEMTKLLRALGINGRKGLGFYTLRHTFRTVADEAKDQPAADFIMGHEVASMSSVYRETISDARLKAVTDHVRDWLFPPTKDK